MAFTQLILLKIPTIPLGILIVAIAVIIAVGGLLLARRFSRIERLKAHHDIAGPLFSTIGVIYAVLLAFVVIIAWQNFDRAKTDVVREATYYADLYRDASGFPEPQKSQIRTAIGTYVKAVVEDEWPALAWGGRSDLAHDLFTRVWECYLGYEPKTESEKTYFSESVRKLNEAGELRTQRLDDARSGIHPVLWFILLVGGLITIVFTFFFGSENFWSHIAMTALFAVLIALILFTALVLDYPFTGDISIQPDAFDALLRMIGSA